MSKKSPNSIAGIYTITNKITGTVYVGQAVNIRKRWEVHRSTLSSGKHRNSYLLRAWAKYGSENFEFSILRDMSNLPHEGIKTALNVAEIEALSIISDTYNLMEAGLSGTLASPETRAIWSKQRKAMWADPEFRRKRSEQTKALYLNPEWKAKRDRSVREAIRSQENRDRASVHMTKLWERPDHKAEQVEKRKANWQDPDYRARVLASRAATWTPEKLKERGAAISKAKLASNARKRDQLPVADNLTKPER